MPDESCPAAFEQSPAGRQILWCISAQISGIAFAAGGCEAFSRSTHNCAMHRSKSAAGKESDTLNGRCTLSGEVSVAAIKRARSNADDGDNDDDADGKDSEETA